MQPIAQHAIRIYQPYLTGRRQQGLSSPANQQALYLPFVLHGHPREREGINRLPSLGMANAVPITDAAFQQTERCECLGEKSGTVPIIPPDPGCSYSTVSTIY